MGNRNMSRAKAYSIASSAYVLLFLVITNVLHTDYPWVLFCLPVFFIWPFAVCSPRLMIHKFFAFVVYTVVVGYYALLNVLLAPEHPWVLYIVFVAAWYPCSLLLRKSKAFALSLFGLVWSILFFSTVNMMTSPHEIWAVYPIFCVMWWPLSLYFFGYKKKKD